MWDEAKIVEVTPFKYKISFPNDYKMYNREIPKDDADIYITRYESIP
jgi:hypothetical protein